MKPNIIDPLPDEARDMDYEEFVRMSTLPLNNDSEEGQQKSENNTESERD